MAATKKRLLISESHDNSNLCKPYMEKSDQCDTYALHVSPRMLDIHFIRAVPVCGNLSWVTDKVGQSSLLLRKRAHDIIHSTSGDRSTGLYPVSHLRQPIKKWRKSNICRQQATRLSEPISPTRDRYIQYLLTGTNPSVLNRHRWGLPHRNLRIKTTLFPPFPSECSTEPLNDSSQSLFYSTLISNNSECISTYCRHVVFWSLNTYICA
jgi:hypothetical protein